MDLKPVDIWTIIDTYFRDTPYYKSQHQIESYNEFLSSNTNGFQHIIKRENPSKIFKDQYEINIYFGETLDKDGKIKKEENIYISNPIIKNKESYMYPNEARLRNLTYKSDIYINIGIEYINNDTKEKMIENFKKINIGSIPIMIHSKLCILNGLDWIKLSEM